MKKTSLFIVTAALALASCSNDHETLNDQNVSTGISFRASADKSRGLVTSNDNLLSFQTYAYKTGSGNNFFSDVEFSREAGQTEFNSATKYYWPVDNSALNFVAYSPNSTDLGADVVINSTSQKMTDFSPKEEIKDQVDFIVAKATGSKDNETNGLALTFNHELSQIEIQAKNANPSYVYKVAGVRIVNVANKSTYDFSGNGSWSNLAQKGQYTVRNSEFIKLSESPASIMGAGVNNALLIPQQFTAYQKTTNETGTYLAVRVRITQADGTPVFPKGDGQYGQYDWVAVGITGTWEKGKKYTYILDFTNGAGIVDPDRPVIDPDKPVYPVTPDPTDPIDPNKPIEPTNPTDPTDPTDPDNPSKPADPIFGSPIKITVNVTNWEPGNGINGSEVSM